MTNPTTQTPLSRGRKNAPGRAPAEPATAAPIDQIMGAPAEIALLDGGPVETAPVMSPRAAAQAAVDAAEENIRRIRRQNRETEKAGRDALNNAHMDLAAAQKRLRSL